MKSQLTFAAAVVTLFVLLPISVQLAAQDKQDHHHKHHRYRLIDIGTFGGPESYVNAAFSLGSPNQINRRGTVVGAAATDIPAPPEQTDLRWPRRTRPFRFHAFVWQEGEKKDLGALPGVECSEAVSINSQGEIPGRSGNAVIDLRGRPGGDSRRHSERWRDPRSRDTWGKSQHCHRHQQPQPSSRIQRQHHS
jgi:hypothetical protein